MRANVTRRDILKLVGGSALGFLFTPVPWKLLDDTAIWTQNWSLIPPLPHGELSVRYSTCTLCPGGCAVKAKCVGGMPYALSGVSHHPVSHGQLCTVGLAGHQMPFHPLRLNSPVKFTGKSDMAGMTCISTEEAMKSITEIISTQNTDIAILDVQPGRALSKLYREFLGKVQRGWYLTSPSREDGTLRALQSMLEENTRPLGFDFESADLILSFNAPLLDGWGTPGRMNALFDRESSGRKKLIQIESSQSRTALGADRWIPVNPGSEYMFARALAKILMEEQSCQGMLSRIAVDVEQYKIGIDALSMDTAQKETGIDAGVMRQIARELTAAGRVIVLGGPDPGGGPLDRDTEFAIAQLNLLLGSVGKKGGIVFRDEIDEGGEHLSPVCDLRDVPDHSLQLLIVDAATSGYAIPWKSLERKLHPQRGMVVSLSPYLNEIAAHADIIIPAPALYESVQDVPTPADACNASFSLSNPLLPVSGKVMEPASFILQLAQAEGIVLSVSGSEELLKRKVNAIHASGRGSIFSSSNGNTTKISEISGSDELWTSLREGATWFDAMAEQGEPVRVRMTTDIAGVSVQSIVDSNELFLMPSGWKGAVSISGISPIMSKIFQESALRTSAGTVYVNPATAKAFDLNDNDNVLLETTSGTRKCCVKTDASVRPGIVRAMVGPAVNGTTPDRETAGILDLCDIQNDGTWRITKVNMKKV